MGSENIKLCFRKKSMEKTAINANHLLEGSLEWLHHQTTEWISDIQFWSEEFTFLYHVLRKSELRLNYPMQQVAELEKELIKISNKDLNELETALGRHERKLRVIIEAPSKINELVYRYDHKVILFSLKDVAEKVRRFKKSVFCAY